MKCIHCGASLSEEARFCTSCGKALYEAPVAEKSAINENIKPTEAAPLFEGEAAATPAFVEETAPVAEAAHEAIEESQPEAPVIPESIEAPSFSDNTEAVAAAPVNLFKEEAAPEVSFPEAKQEAVKAPEALAPFAGGAAHEPIYEQNEILPVEDAPKKLTAGRVIGATAISVFAVIFLIAVSFVFSARIGLSSDIVKKSAESINAGVLLDLELDDDKTVAEYVHEKMHGSFITKSGAEVKDVRSFIIKTDIVDFIAGRLSDYSAYLVDGTKSSDPSVDSKELADFFRNNDKLITQEFGYEMKDKDYDDVQREFSDAGIDEALSVEEWSDKLGFNMKNANILFSFITIGILLALTLVFYIWAAIVLDRHTRTIMGYIGNITFIGGLIVFIPCLAVVLAALTSTVWSSSAIAYALSRLLLPFAAIGACTGLFEIIVGTIFKKIRKHIRKKELKAHGSAV